MNVGTKRTPKLSCRQMPIDVVGVWLRGGSVVGCVVGVWLMYGCDRLVDLEEDGPNGWAVQDHGEYRLRTDKGRL